MSMSDVINARIVPILGCIIPEPFAIPPTTTFFPSISIDTVISFLIISVVIIPSLAAICPLLLSWLASFSILSSIKSIFNGSPITPVDATKTSSGFKFNTSAVDCAILKACSNPSLHLHY